MFFCLVLSWAQDKLCKIVEALAGASLGAQW